MGRAWAVSCVVALASGCSLLLSEADGDNGGGDRDGGLLDGPMAVDASETDGPMFASRWPDSPTAICSDGDTLIGCEQVTTPQDGKRVSPRPEYTVSEPNRIVDSVTGLTWDSSAGSLNQTAAGSACDDITPGTWRQPTLIELISLVDFGKVPPHIDVSFGIVGTVWSSQQGLVFNFGTGSIESAGGAEDHFALCVQGAGLEPAFSNVAPYTDDLTGLVFKTPLGNGVWFEQMKVCGNGRPATAKELLLFTHGGAPVILPEAGMWTGSPSATQPANALAFFPNSSPPSMLPEETTNNRPVVCVEPQ